MMERRDLICPLALMGEGGYLEPCLGSRCAWWLRVGKCCAVIGLAWLADDLKRLQGEVSNIGRPNAVE